MRSEKAVLEAMRKIAHGSGERTSAVRRVGWVGIPLPLLACPCRRPDSGPPREDQCSLCSLLSVLLLMPRSRGTEANHET
jgi:hypothetical protein